MAATDITWRAQLISMPEIAEIAGVQRPVVTTWRRRPVSFPAQAGTRPLFDAREVIEWLVATGRAERPQVEPELQMHTLAALRAPPGSWPSCPGPGSGAITVSR